MKKLLYVSFENAENRASGVNKKIFGQMKIFDEEGFSSDLVAIHGDSIAFFERSAEPQIFPAGTSKFDKRKALCGWAALNAKEYQAAYIRFQFFCPFVLKMVKAFHRANVKVVMEIPTYPYVPELVKQGKSGIPKRVIDACFRNASAKYIDWFAAPLYGDPIMGKPCIEIRNGINVDEVQARNPIQHEGEIHLLAVAMMAPWHGYDRLIEGLHQYRKNGGKEKVILHLVGEGAATPGYQELIQKYGLKDCVIQHGKMHGEELDAMYDIADIGVGSLGIHRTEIKKTNTLKIMEYMAKGIPVICEHSECGIPERNKYRLTVNDDESPLDVGEITKFYHSIYDGVEPDVINREIRDACRENCNIKAGLQDVIDFLK